jgi:hypothetical protein
MKTVQLTLAALVAVTTAQSTSNWCGSSWGDANTRCHTPCDGTDKVRRLPLSRRRSNSLSPF